MKFPRSPVSITRCDLKYGCTGIIATLQTKHLALAALSPGTHEVRIFIVDISSFAFRTRWETDYVIHGRKTHTVC